MQHIKQNGLMLNVWQTSTNNDENENPLEKNDQIVKMDIIKKIQSVKKYFRKILSSQVIREMKVNII